MAATVPPSRPGSSCRSTTMIFNPTELAGVLRVEAQPHTDERGSFTRAFSVAEFQDHGIELAIIECSISRNVSRLTMRGMHYQAAPHEEGKLVRCLRGRIWDVALDLRPGSATHLKWVGVELSADNQVSLWIPGGLAHGYLTLEPDSEILYHMTAGHVPGAARGVRWDDPAFQIDWPDRPAVIADRDATYPDYHSPSDEGGALHA